MREIQRYRKFGGYANSTDYNALAGSTFMSPAQLKKTRGFVDFDQQLFRQDMRRPNAHENRFDPFNHFPKNLTDNKPIRQVDFNKMPFRDNKFQDVKCSDALFENKHMDLYKKQRQGILHFTNSVVNRGDESKPFERLKVMSNNTLPCRCRNPVTRIPKNDPPNQFDDNEMQSPEDIVRSAQKI